MAGDTMREAAEAMWRLRRPDWLEVDDDLASCAGAEVHGLPPAEYLSTGERAYLRLLASAAGYAGARTNLARDLGAIDAERRIEVLAVLAQA